MQLDYLKDLGNIYLQKGEIETGLNYLKEYLIKMVLSAKNIFDGLCYRECHNIIH